MNNYINIESDDLDKDFLNTMLFGGFITNEMKDKWTTIIFHTKMGKAPGEGFSKMYVNDVLYNDYDGRTGYGGRFFNKFGIYHSWISRWNDEVHGKYPTQVVYYDNLFRTSSKEKLLKLIQN